MKSIIGSLVKGSSRVVNSVVLAEDTPVGIISPSTFEGITNTNEYHISGPLGITPIEDSQNEESIYRALIETGSIIFGSPKDIQAVARLLHSSDTSRTTSYYCTIARNCGEVLHASNRVKNARVLVIGCGGIGSLTAAQLAGAGIGHITLMDPDEVEASNLNRQLLWSRSDVGRKKVTVLQERLLERYSFDCQTLAEAAEECIFDEVTDGIDAVVLSADEPIGVGQSSLTRLAIDKEFLLISTGYSHHRAVIRIVDGKSKAPNEDICDDSDVRWYRSPNFIGPSFGPMNVELSGVAASVLIHKLGFPERYSYNRQPEDMLWIPSQRHMGVSV